MGTPASRLASTLIAFVAALSVVLRVYIVVSGVMAEGRSFLDGLIHLAADAGQLQARRMLSSMISAEEG